MILPLKVRRTLKSWTHPPDAQPHPAPIKVNPDSAEADTGFCAKLTPAEAQAAARAVLRFTTAAEQEAPQDGTRPDLNCQIIHDH